MISFSAPGKIHLLGEHAVVFGKPALLTTVNLRVFVTISKTQPSSVIPTKVGIHTGKNGSQIKSGMTDKLQKTIETIVKKHLKLKAIPPYQLEISSQLPIGSGLGSSAAISAAFIAALLSFLKVKWDLNLINELTFKAEKIFHGNPSGADNSTVIFGGLIWFRKETDELKIIKKLSYSIPAKLAKNFILINTGTPKESTKEMVELVSSKFKVQSAKFKKIFDDQEKLVKELLFALQDGQEKQLIEIIRTGEQNLEKIGVVSPFVKSIIRKIEQAGGAAKICGGGGKAGPTGVLLCFHSKPSIIEEVAKSQNLDYFKTTLGTEGLRNEIR